jgi:hypothetical protein
MTKKEKAEQVFRRLSLENRCLLLRYFETALKAEDSVKKDLGIAGQAGQGRADEGTGEARESR